MKYGFALVVAGVVALAGCDKHSESCKKAADLSAPWTDLSLPVQEGRVCKSGADEVQVEYGGKDQDKWMTSYGEKLTGAGWVKKGKMECNNKTCSYEKDDAWVHVMGGTIAEKWVRITIKHHKGKGTKSSDDTKSAKSTKDEKEEKKDNKDEKKDEKQPEASTGEKLGIKACDDYVDKVKACKSIKSHKPLERLVERWKKWIEEGKKDKAQEACEEADKILKCKD